MTFSVDSQDNLIMTYLTVEHYQGWRMGVFFRAKRGINILHEKSLYE